MTTRNFDDFADMATTMKNVQKAAKMAALTADLGLGLCGYLSRMNLTTMQHKAIVDATNVLSANFDSEVAKIASALS